MDVFVEMPVKVPKNLKEDLVSWDPIQLLNHLVDLHLHKQSRLTELHGCAFGSISPFRFC